MTAVSWRGVLFAAALAVPLPLPSVPAAPPVDEATAAVRVRALIAQDLWREALEEAGALAAARPDSAAAKALLGEALYRAGRIAEAAALLGPLVASGAPPPRALAVLGLARVAEGKDDEGAALLDRALAAAPDDRFVVFWAAGGASTRAETIARLEKYLALSEGDDKDRIEGARGTIRLYRALGERPVWVPKNRPERLELPLHGLAGAPGRNRGYLIDAVLGDGKRARLLLDTGSGGLFLLDRIAKKGGLVPLSEETVFAGGGEGRQASRRGLLPAFALGELRFADALVSTTTEEIEPTGRYHGIVGLSVFAGYRVTIDLDRNRLVLEPSPAAAAGSPYWTVSGQILVEARARGGAAGLFMLDTGAARTEVSSTLARSVPGASLGPPIPVRGYGGNMPGTRLARGLGVEFQALSSEGAELIAADLTMRSRLGGVELSGMLGLDLLDGTRITVDTKARTIEIVRASKR